jgi:DNA replication and repair protein RecF
MAFISGSPEKRRWFFDQNRSLYDIEYLDFLRRYKKVLKTRNAVIREAQNSNQKTILDVLEPQLVEYGTRIMEKREEETAFFSKVFGPIYQKVSKIEKIEVLYRPSWKMKSTAEIVEYLANTRERDILMGTTLSGPHRDRYLFTQDGQDFVETGSTGQRRLLALLLRIAQATRYREMTGNLPTLLFDDVLLELDGEKRKKILSELPKYEQAFFTFLPEEPYNNYRHQDTLVYFVKTGKLTAEER